MSADQHIERPERLAEAFDVCANLAEMDSGFRRECQDLKPRTELLDGLQILQAPSRFFRAVKEFRKRDARHAKLLGKPVESLAQLRRVVLDHIDADVGAGRRQAQLPYPDTTRATHSNSAFWQN